MFSKKNSLKIAIFLPLAVFSLALGFRLWGLNEQGETFDEIAYYNGGRAYVKNLHHLDFNSDHWAMTFEHPPVGKWIYGLVATPTYRTATLANRMTPGRLASAVMGSLTVLLVYFLALELFKSKKVALASALILTFLPYFVGHNKVMGLETPSALFYTATVYLFYLGLTRNSRCFIWTGVLAGLAVGTRFNNAHIFLFIALSGAAFYLFSKRGGWQKNSWLILSIPIIAVALVWAIYPWIWQDPIGHLKQNQHFLQTQINTFTDGHMKEWFLGKLVAPPNYYYLVYYLAVVPILTIILQVVFLVKTVIRPSFTKIYLWLWFLTPFVMSFEPFKQDGLRYVFPVLVPLSIMAGYSAVTAFNHKYLKIFLPVFVIINLLVIDINIHPNYLDYYSSIFGGTKGVYQNKSFKVSWWGEGVLPAYRYLNENAPDGARVLSLISADFSQDYLRDDISRTTFRQIMGTNNNQFDYIVTNPGFYFDRPLAELKEIDISQYSNVFEAKTGGAPMATVYKLAK